MTLASVQTFFSNINWGEVFATIGSYVPDAIQIAILYFVIYSVLKAARGSRFGQVLMGAGILVTALAAFTFLFQFDVLQKILSGLLIYLALSTVVLFQPEIRRILETVGAVLTEDTRNSGRLLSYFGIKKPMVSYFEHNKRERGEEIVRRIEDGASCALITDAGMPAISDPGEDIVRLCAERGIPVCVVPGACAAVLQGNLRFFYFFMTSA